ncbi:Oar protein [Acidisarcina polymorpha]|uniref:Oar protein n=1 Tax=Acidisarcina polymorpha TaxID=2211140 RepID=A0A2Z5G9M4_9BACT|nr:carboxypeptidase regulatory-like domain-containing protein [Acidisarcina polymorpha]AXC15851.1 Oar protein [Acidisarcina polymorpha]
MRKRSEKVLGYVLLVVAIGWICGQPIAVEAQVIYGSIFGTVTDATGAAIPNATITVTDQSKGTSVVATSNPSGEYTVRNLIPDVYDVKATAAGFGTVDNPGIQVSADTSPKVDLKLTVGSASSTVTVTSEAPQLQTDRAEVGTVFNQKTISGLPITGRNFASLELLIPGAQSMSWQQNNAEDAQGSPTVNIQGQFFAGVGYLLDGASNQDPILGQIVINPPLDAIGEAKIITQSYDAEFGQSVAAVVNAQTKSGTNSLHGDAFDYRRSDAQQARNPFNQSAPYSALTSRLIPPALYSQFGGSLGGPILKNKLFFFGDYQGVRQRNGASAQVTVPTALAHNSCLSGAGCDLSEFLIGRGTAQGQIYNPRVFVDSTGAVVAPTTPGAQPQAFANNFIPNQYLSPQALYLLNLIPLPNAPGTQDGTANNYNGGGTGVTNQNQFDVRVDYELREGIHTFGRYSYFDNANSAGTIFGAAGGAGFQSAQNDFGGSAKGKNQSAVAGMDVALNPKLLTDFRLGYLRYHVSTEKYDGTEDLAAMAGIPGLNLGTTFTAGAPGFFMNNASGTSGDGLSSFGSSLQVNACNCHLQETEDQYQVVNNWTKIIGNHSIRFGADLRYARNLRVPSDNNRAGEITFSATDTENTTASAPAPGGLGLASFLLGDVTNFARYVSTSVNAKESQKIIFSYVQDNWRITPNLTLTAGLRWEVYFPETVNGVGQGGFADLTNGSIRVAGVGPYNTAMNVQKDFKNIAPRLGLAYQLDPKTVIRAGYGRSFDIGVFGTLFGHVVTQNLPVLANQNLTNAGANTAAFNLSTGPTPFTFPTVPASGLIPIPNGLAAKVRGNPQLLPTVDAWNLSIQRQLTSSLSATIAYAGNKGSHTFAGDGQTVNLNAVGACIPGVQSITGQGLCWDPNAPATQPVAGQATTSNTNYLRHYFAQFGWTQDLTYYHDGFDSHYNALQLTLDKHFTQGLQFTARYSWQSSLNYGNNDYDEINRKVMYGRFDDLREQEFQLYGNYDLPFGRNRQLFNNVPTWANYLIAGWESGTSLNWSSGLPFTPSYGECGSDIPNGPCMPNKAGGVLPTHLTSFNTASHSRTYFTPVAALTAQGSTSGPFSRPGLDQFGNAGRNSYFGPSFFNTDLSVSKNTPIHENINAQFRLDAFNVFNFISPANPSSCIDCPGNGVITGMAIGAQPRQLEFSVTVLF